MWTFFVALVINIGMWFERFDIIVVDLSKDRLTSSWTLFEPTFVDIGTFMGTIGFFFVLFLLYARTFPVIAQAEVKTILKTSGEAFKRLRAEHGDDVSHVQTVEEYPAEAGPAANVEDKHFKSVFNKEDQDEPNPDVDFERHRGQIDRLLNAVGTFDPATQTQDDLKKISGVGPVMEQKLHQVGIFTFDQVSRMTDREYELLDEIISEFQGRAKRDDWAGQALMLKNKK